MTEGTHPLWYFPSITGRRRSPIRFTGSRRSSLRRRPLTAFPRMQSSFTGSSLTGCSSLSGTDGSTTKEKSTSNGIGLITRIHQGLGKPDRIYVHRCTLPQMEIRGSPSDDSDGPDSGNQAESAGLTDEGAYGDFVPSSEVSEIHVQRCKKYPSKGAGNIPLEVSERSCNKTEINKTEMSETDLIPSNGEGIRGQTAASRAARRRGPKTGLPPIIDPCL